VWRGFFGERARTAVFGWSEQAFAAPYLRRKVLRFTVFMPLQPDAIQHVLLDNAANYAKPDIVKALLAPTIGRGLLSSDGSLWRSQRRIVASSFTPPAVDALIPAFENVAGRTMAHWTPGTRDIAAEAVTATMSVISDALFSGDPRLTSRAAMEHIAAALEGASEARLQLLLGLPVIPLTRKSRAGRRGQIYLRETLSALVRERLAGGPDDFLTGMIRGLTAQFAEGEALELAVDNAATFYLAGHETTANALTWALYLLSRQPELQSRAADEARAALSAPGADLPDRVPLLRRILEETLRLYPPAPRFDRQAVASDKVGGVDVAPGDIVSIWPWLVHRHKALWDDPDAFDPERFVPEARARHHRFQYIPFGAGPRVCVGARFATAEALALLAHWLSRWSFAPVPGREVRPSGLVTLRPEGGMPLILSIR
jgi:cytochrome P450